VWVGLTQPVEGPNAKQASWRKMFCLRFAVLVPTGEPASQLGASSVKLIICVSIYVSNYFPSSFLLPIYYLSITYLFIYLLSTYLLSIYYLLSITYLSIYYLSIVCLSIYHISIYCQMRPLPDWTPRVDLVHQENQKHPSPMLCSYSILAGGGAVPQQCQQRR
jgi:hypothetical protein